MEKATLQGNLYYGNFKAQVLAHKPHGIIKLFVPGITPMSFDISLPLADQEKMFSYNTYVKENNPKSGYVNVEYLYGSMTDDNRSLYLECLPDAYPALSLFGGTGAYNHAYSYPHIGSWVWCFFENGQHTRPIYFASVPGGQYSKYEYDKVLEFNDNPNNRITELTDNPIDTKNEDEVKLVSYNTFNHRRHSFVTGKNKVTMEEDGRLLIEVGYVPEDGEEKYNLYTSPYGNNTNFNPEKIQSQEEKTTIEICQSNISIRVPKTKKIYNDEEIANELDLSKNIMEINEAITSEENFNRTYTLSKTIKDEFKEKFNTRHKIQTTGENPLISLNAVTDKESEQYLLADNAAYYEAVINIDCERKINITCPEINVYSTNVNTYNSENINLVNGKSINIVNTENVNLSNGKSINISNGEIVNLNSVGNINITTPTIAITGEMTITGNINCAADVVASGISLTKHVHKENDYGKLTSGPRIPE